MGKDEEAEIDHKNILEEKEGLIKRFVTNIKTAKKTKIILQDLASDFEIK